MSQPSDILLQRLQGFLDTLTQTNQLLQQIVENTRIPVFHATRRISMATAGKWYNFPFPLIAKSWFIRLIPNTATLKIMFSRTQNLAEEPPDAGNYSTIDPGGSRAEDTRPLGIWVQSDTANSFAEIEVWV